MPLKNGCGMVAQAGGRGRGFQALAALALLLAACAAPPPAAVPVARTYHSMPQASIPLPPASTAATLVEYQREVAGLLHAANAGMVFDGPPPNPLRAVIVMRAEIDVLGEARRLDLVRAPWHDPWLPQLVAQTLRRAQPFPRPSMKLLDGKSSVTLTETWLFDYEGRFRLRSLSEPQAAPPPDDEEPAP